MNKQEKQPRNGEKKGAKDALKEDIGIVERINQFFPSEAHNYLRLEVCILKFSNQKYTVLDHYHANKLGIFRYYKQYP